MKQLQHNFNIFRCQEKSETKLTYETFETYAIVPLNIFINLFHILKYIGGKVELF